MLTVASRETSVLLGCARRWLAHAESLDSAPYEHEVASFGSNASGTGEYMDARWKDAVRAKPSSLSALLRRLPPRAEVLLLDTDVVTLRPLRRALPALGPATDMLFMREPAGHGGATGRMVVNTGFVLVRNSRRSQQFAAHWAWRLKGHAKRLTDQDVANWILLHPTQFNTLNRTRLRWSFLPRSLAATEPEQVGPSTAAYHAIFASGTAAKLGRLRRAIRGANRSAELAPMCAALAGAVEPTT